MKYAIYMPNFGYFKDPIDIANIAFEAEQSGWDGFFLWDHLVFTGDLNVNFLNPWITLATIAMKTKNIKIGPLITPVPRRLPWELAREALTLDHLSNGRLVLGVGLGTPEEDFTSFGDNFDPIVRAKKLDEGLDILIGLWSGKDFTYEGEYYQVKNIRFLPKPVNENIPIWVAGTWPIKKPFKRAAKYDGVFPISSDWPRQLSPNDIRQIKDYIYENRVKVNNFDIIKYGNTPGDPSEGIKIVEPYKDVGVTWWCENIDRFRFSNSSERMIERIRKGPPK